MATRPQDIPLGQGVPAQALNQQDATGKVSRLREALRVADGHRIGLQNRRSLDLTREKYLLHVNGEGDLQYADIYEGSRIVVPQSLSGSVRIPANLLRPLVENMVAYHTTQPFAFTADSKQDRESKDRARIDAAIVNHVAKTQRWNSLAAGAMQIGAAYGHGILHAYWRDDLAYDPYEPLYLTGEQQQGMYLPRRGIIDCFEGNPFDTVYNAGAKRNSVQWMSYGRILPGPSVRQAFAHVPGIEQLEGSRRMPSASVFQRVGRKWLMSGINVHGTAIQYGGSETAQDEELIALVCREYAPGVLPDHPDGRLVIAGLRVGPNGELDTSKHSTPLLLHDGPLPAKRFSAVRLYTGFQYDDVLGSPFVAGLDDLQMQHNLLENLIDDYFRKAVKSPLIHNGITNDVSLAWEDDSVLEYAPGSQPPQWLTPASDYLQYLERKIERVEETMFRIGGWQAASRGEAQPGQPAALAVYLGRADDTVHGPVNLMFRQSMCEFAELTHALFAEYGDVGWTLNVVGDDLAHLAEEFVDNTRVSPETPHFRMTNGYGATPEATKQELLNMVVAAAPDGAPILPIELFRKKWSSTGSDLYDTNDDPYTLQKRRAETVAQRIRDFARDALAQYQLDPKELSLASPEVWPLGQQVFLLAEETYPRLRDDDLQSHLDALSAITQDETENAVARVAAMQRQDLLYEWQALIAAQQQMVQTTPGQGGQSGGSPGAPQAVDSDMGQTPSSQSAEMAADTVPALTQEAQAMGA